MKKICMLVLLLCCFTMTCFAEAGWKDCQFPNLLSFKYPSTLALREESYQGMMSSMKNFKDGNRSNFNLSFKPIAINDNSCRVSVRVMTGRKDSSFFDEPLKLSQEELSAFQGEYLLSVSEDLKTQVDLVNPAEIYTVDGKQCIYMEYHYTMGGKKWYNYVYNFNDGDRRYRVTIRLQADKYQNWTKKPYDVRDIVRTLTPIG